MIYKNNDSILIVLDVSLAEHLEACLNADENIIIPDQP